MAVISAPENLARLDRYRDDRQAAGAGRGAHRRPGARRSPREGKAIVWIDGGLHANEVLGAQQLIETVYQLVSRTDAETQRFLRDVIVLAVHANPDGHELVADWYMREPAPSRRTLAGVPRAYQKYVGHDNNRDFYMSTQAETDQHEPRALPGVVSADRLQPSPDRPARHGDVRAAVPRSVQLRLRSADPGRHRPGRRGDAQPLRRRGQAAA